jgi:O-antigen/teichoic acid export membrane protein
VQILGYVLTREKKFYKLGNNRIIEVLSSQSLKIGIGLIHPTFLGLFISQIVGYLLNLYLAKNKSNISFVFSKKKMLIVFKRYINFLLYSTPAIFINTLAMQLPIFFIVKYFGTEFLGYYVFAIKLIDIPLGIVGNAIGQVYYKEAVDKFHIGIEHLFTLYKNILKKLIIFMIIPSILIYILAEPLIPYFLGENWVTTGKIMSILIIWKFFEFINSPISTTLIVLNRQNIDLFLKIFLSFGLRFIVLLYFNNTFLEMICAITISASIYYAIFNLTTYFILRSKNEI